MGFCGWNTAVNRGFDDEPVGSDDHRAVAFLRLIIEDILKIICAQRRPIALSDDLRALNHHRRVKRRVCRTINTQGKEAVTLFGRVIAQTDMLLKSPAVPRNYIRHFVSPFTYVNGRGVVFQESFA